MIANQYAVSAFFVNRKMHYFNGTTMDLAKRVNDLGLRVGKRFKANYGGTERQGAREVVVVAAPHEACAGGLWVE